MTSTLGKKLKSTLPKAVSEIRGRLKILLGIGADPFQPYRKAGGYKTRFTMRSEFHEQDDGRRWDE